MRVMLLPLQAALSIRILWKQIAVEAHSSYLTLPTTKNSSPDCPPLQNNPQSSSRLQWSNHHPLQYPPSPDLAQHTAVSQISDEWLDIMGGAILPPWSVKSCYWNMFDGKHSAKKANKHELKASNGPSPLPSSDLAPAILLSASIHTCNKNMLSLSKY